MENMLVNNTNMELFFVYGLIALVILLIIVIIVIDRRESKNRQKSLFDTLNMKIIASPDDVIAETMQKEMNHEPSSEVIEIHHPTEEQMVLPLEETSVIASDEFQDHTDSMKDIFSDLEESYQETDLEKTQAQIRVEEITKALEQAQIEEQIQEDKYKKFEEEQEKNAIISYHELKESYDKLYTENEKTQYLEDNQIPINLEELYQLKEEQDVNSKEENKTVKLKDFSMQSEPKVNQQKPSTFKSSPVISPVYGIQKEPLEPKAIVDKELTEANEFLKNLKELKNNLN